MSAVAWEEQGVEDWRAEDDRGSNASAQALRQLERLSGIAVSDIERSAPPADRNLEMDAEFRRLVAQWLADTSTSSALDQRLLHPAYLRVIGLGRDVVPLVLAEVAAGNGLWMWALEALTGEDPTDADDSMVQARRKWVAWGTARGLLATDA